MQINYKFTFFVYTYISYLINIIGGIYLYTCMWLLSPYTFLDTSHPQLVYPLFVDYFLSFSYKSICTYKKTEMQSDVVSYQARANSLDG